MTEKMKNYVGWAVIISVILLALSAVAYVRTYSRMVEPGGYRSFSVSGDGKAVAVPDIAEFNFSVISEGGADLAALQKSNTDKVNKAIAYIKSQGVADKDIKTAGYNVSPRYQNTNCGYRGYAETCPPPEIVGYTVQQTVTVKARDFAKVGTMLAGAVENGANTVSQLNFTVDDPTEVQNEARAEAIDKAKAKAESIARAGDFKLGRLISINENGMYPMPMYDKAMSAVAYGMGGAGAVSNQVAPSIQPGSEEVTVSVMLTYEIN